MMVEPRGCGWIEVICGPMFSGKTEELIRRLKRAEIARQKVQVFKPAIDTRFSSTHVVSHSDLRKDATVVSAAQEILERVDPDTRVVGLDEAQFFDERVLTVANRLAWEGRRVVVAGLDLDYRGVPFEPMPQLMSVAEYVTKLLSICVVCGSPANYSQKLSSDGGRVEVGAKDLYEARCRIHFEPPDRSLFVGRTRRSEAPGASEVLRV